MLIHAGVYSYTYTLCIIDNCYYISVLKYAILILNIQNWDE